MGTPLCHSVYNEVLGMTNDFLLPATVKYMKKEPRYREQILPVRLALRYSYIDDWCTMCVSCDGLRKHVFAGYSWHSCDGRWLVLIGWVEGD